MLTGIEKRRRLLSLLFAALLATLAVPAAKGTTIDVRCRKALFLPHSGQFIAQDAMNGVALYRLNDRGLVHSFRAGAEVLRFAVTPDEKVLFLPDLDGNLSAHDLTTGQPVWHLSRWQTGLTSIWDVSFSQDGRFTLACGGDKHEVLILETATGKLVRTLPTRLSRPAINSAALCPDGSRGVCTDSDGNLFAFEVATGLVKKLRSIGPTARIRYSVDGKYVVVLEAVQQQFQILAASGDWPVQLTGPPGYTGCIKSAEDGGFLVTQVNGDLEGQRWRPGAKDLEVLWHRPFLDEEGISDFLPDELIGISTDFRLVTRLIDLRTGAELGKVDNSANYRVTILSTTVSGFPGGLAALGVVAVLAVIAAVSILRRRRTTHCPSPRTDDRGIRLPN
jgi:WD40 repeat protein